MSQNFVFNNNYKLRKTIQKMVRLIGLWVLEKILYDFLPVLELDDKKVSFPVLLEGITYFDNKKT